MTIADEYRAKAAQCRSLMDRTNDGQLARNLGGMIAEYERQAERAERRTWDPLRDAPTRD